MSRGPQRKRQHKQVDQKLGVWTLGKRLGAGGNGEVYRVRSTTGVVGALKRPHRRLSAKGLMRFVDEVEAMRKCADIPGVIPVLDANVPAKVGDGDPWIVMGEAEHIQSALGAEPPLRLVVGAVRDIAETLQHMHARGVSHRDIKPENLFRFHGHWAVGDFGLADFEGKLAETALGERVGPLLYIAPEMLNDPTKHDGVKADVFSLVKVLWTLATGQAFPLPGAYERNTDAFRIGSYLVEERTDSLDRLIVAGTMFNPAQRPAMAQVVEELSAWLSPPPAQPMAIKLDFGPNTAKLATQRASNEAAERREFEANEMRVAAALRMRERFRPLAQDIGDALRPAHFDRLEVAIDNIQWGFRVLAIARESGNQLTELSIELVADPVIFPTMTLTAMIDVRRSGAQVVSTRVWESTVTFLDGGSEEQIKTADLEASMRAQIQAAVEKAMDLAFSNWRHSSEKEKGAI